MIDWARYAIGGAAARLDSFTGLDQDYAARVAQLVMAADAELGPQALRITSAYRSPEKQAELYQAAIAKYGSPEAARKWVAPPGKSQHNRGMAVDFANAQGSLLRDPNSREAQWIKANASRFGLDVPMEWEPWQVEMAGARGGSSPQAAPSMPSNALGQPPQAPQEAPQNALQPFRMADMRQSVDAFQRPQNALSLVPVQAQRQNILARYV